MSKSPSSLIRLEKSAPRITSIGVPNSRISDHYCRKLFNNIYIEKHGVNQVKISPCCIGMTNLSQPVDTIDFSKNKVLVRQRQQSMHNQRVPECGVCWQREDQGFISQRERYGGKDPFKVELQSIDYNVSPICNARCIICSSQFSSAWAQEDEKFGMPPRDGRTFSRVRTNSVDQDLDLSKVHKIYFNGGEPMLSQEPCHMLRRIKQAKGTLSNVKVAMNTNASIFPDTETIALWHECSEIQINFSIDACGKEFDYIRFPLAWSLVVDNICNIMALNLPRVRFCVGTVVGIHNFLEVPVLHDWIESLNKTHNITWQIHPALGIFGLNNISDDLKLRVKSTPGLAEKKPLVNSFVDDPRDPQPQQDWMQYLQILDHRRGQDWRISLPKLAEFMA